MISEIGGEEVLPSSLEIVCIIRATCIWHRKVLNLLKNYLRQNNVCFHAYLKAVEKLNRRYAKGYTHTHIHTSRERERGVMPIDKICKSKLNKNTYVVEYVVIYFI